MKKIYLPEDEYTILKFRFFEIVWQHHKPFLWLMFSTKYFEIEYSFAEDKYKWWINFGLNLEIQRQYKTKYLYEPFRIVLSFKFFWFFLSIYLGYNDEYPFKEWMLGEWS